MSQPPSSGPMPFHLMKRRRQVYRVRRRTHTFGAAVARILAEAASGGTEAPQAVSAAAEVAPQLEGLRAEIDSLTAARTELEMELAKVRETLALRDKGMEEARRVLDQAKAQVQRTRQEMEQQRRRHEKEKEEVQKYAAEELLRQLLPLLDNFALAVDSIDQGAPVEGLLKGFRMVHREMTNLLEGIGFRRMPTVGEPFDPSRHDAATAECDETQPDGVILKELRSGYLLGDKVLRPAMVMVNKHAAGQGPPADEDQPPRAVKPTMGLPNGTPPQNAESEKDEPLPEGPLDQARRMLDTQGGD